MTRKGFTSVDELRGHARGGAERRRAEHERAGYVNAMREANSSPYGPWS